MPLVDFQSEDKMDNLVVKLRPPHLDDELVPVRRDVAEGCCCCEETPGEKKERGRKGRKEMGRGRRHGGRRVTG